MKVKNSEPRTCNDFHLTLRCSYASPVVLRHEPCQMCGTRERNCISEKHRHILMGHTNLASGRYIFRNPHISNVMYCTTYVMS